MANTTMKDVAERAGVSTATVSRVINKADNVNPELREQVLKVIEELDYKPNQLARSLKSSVTNTIAFISSDISNPFFIKIAKKVEEGIRNDNYTIIIGSTEDDPQAELKYLKLLYEKRVDGIVISSTGENEDYLKELSRKMPVICIDRRPETHKLNSVYVDKEKATYEAVNYLAEKKHKKIALVTGAKSIITNYDRYIGYIKGIYENDITLNSNYIKFGQFSFEFGEEALLDLLDLEERPTAVIAGNSFITAGVLLKAKELNLSIPKDLSLISFGNIANSQLITPKLTFIDEKVDEIGEKASDLLLAGLKDKKSKIREIKIKTKINNGDSVAVLNSSK